MTEATHKRGFRYPFLYTGITVSDVFFLVLLVFVLVLVFVLIILVLLIFILVLVLILVILVVLILIIHFCKLLSPHKITYCPGEGHRFLNSLELAKGTYIVCRMKIELYVFSRGIV